MNSVLTLLCLLLGAFIVFAVPALVAPYSLDYGVVTRFDASKGVLLCAVVAAPVAWFAYRQKTDGPFLFKLFISALLARVFLGTVIFAFDGLEFFGGDAITYDFYGQAQLLGWGGDKYFQSRVDGFIGTGYASGWGMVYLVAGIYGLIGRNMLAVQLVNSVMGAATAVVIFLCAHHVFNNLRVARLAAIAVAFYPSLVLWSSQGLKDGPIVFLLALSILATLRLGEKFSVKYAVILVSALFLLLSFRFYVFYMITAAVGGAFVIGMQRLNSVNFIRQFAIILILGLGLTYLGITRYAEVQLSQFATLERIQVSRQDSATSAVSGFGRDIDVSTGAGALSAIPLGLLYLLFAPFPWELASLRQSITLPEMIIWWISFPMLVLGLWFSVRYRLRQISPIIIFTVMLSIAYSIFQGNVGNAYRQRSQLLVFYFIFVAVGYVLLWEKREERRRLEMANRQPGEASLTIPRVQQR